MKSARQQGTVLIEFTLSFLIFWMVFIGILEFGRALLVWNTAAEATRIAMANQQAALEAAKANQSTAFNREQSNASLAQQATLANQEAARLAATQNQNTALALGQSNASLAQQASLANQDNTFRTSTFNENNRLTGAQQNLDQLGAASNFVDSQKELGLNTQLGMASVEAQYNPLFRNLGIGNTYAASGTGTQAAGCA
jgi:Flp pilus assembly protein TadG